VNDIEKLSEKIKTEAAYYSRALKLYSSDTLYAITADLLTAASTRYEHNIAVSVNMNEENETYVFTVSNIDGTVGAEYALPYLASPSEEYAETFQAVRDLVLNIYMTYRTLESDVVPKHSAEEVVTKWLIKH